MDTARILQDFGCINATKRQGATRDSQEMGHKTEIIAIEIKAIIIEVNIVTSNI